MPPYNCRTSFVSLLWLFEHLNKNKGRLLDSCYSSKDIV